ncbi:MAG: hypothetical protein RJA13_322 [Bacteroidota bacterium]|jgi:hypothetical protein
MMDKNTHFPQYRKLSNGKTFYKIVDERTFEEIVLMGEKRMSFKTVADKYPEMLRIKDMLELEVPFLMATEEEYSDFSLEKDR